MSLCRWLLGSLLLSAPIFAQSALFQAGPIQAGNVHAAPTAPSVGVGAVYLWIDNRGASADALLGAETPIAAKVEMHRSTMRQGMMQMREVTTLEVGPGVTKIEPGGLHFMLLGLKQPLVAGTSFPLSLKFRDAGVLVVQVFVAVPH